MGRYVDANGLKQTFCAECSHSIKCEDCDIEYHFEHFPTADVVEVVRCKDCKHYSEDGWGYGNCYRRSVEYLRMKENGFCSYGERREDEQ